jgi:Type I phosphodiesterase / nucleotide pyrophosphatase
VPEVASGLELVRPRYGEASLAEVLPSVLAVLGVPGEEDLIGLRAALDGVRRVVVLLVDGLGWYQLDLAGAHAPTLRELARDGLSPITAGFPSTTPTSLVSLGTGTPPGAHGILGFTLNVPGTDRVLNHIEWWDDPPPRDWQPLPTVFDRAAKAGLRTAVVSRAEYVGSGLTVAAYRGAPFLGWSTVDDLGAELLAALDEASLVYGYYPDVDRAGHFFGVDSQPWQAAVAEVDRVLARLLDGLPADAALLITADHGQLDVPTAARYDMAVDRRLVDGVRVVAGEPRVRYLHTKPGAADDVVATWRGVLGTAAWVATRAEAVAAGWFGTVPERHLQRVGDVVVACHGRHAVLATGMESPLVGRLVAYHGSYTAVEMLVPLLVSRR